MLILKIGSNILNKNKSSEFFFDFECEMIYKIKKKTHRILSSSTTLRALIVSNKNNNGFVFRVAV